MMNFSDTVNVCFAMPAIWTGGAERWAWSLINNFDPRRVRALFVANECPSCISDTMRELLAKRVRIIHGQSAIDMADEMGCVFICWGMTGDGFNFEGVSSPIVNVLHGANDKCDWTKERLQWALRSNAHNVAVNPACLDVVPEEHRDTFTIIPNGADPERVVPRIGREAAMKLYGINQGDKIVSHIGRISPDKGIGHLVNAVVKLPSEWRLLLCGPAEHWKEPLGEWKGRLEDRLIIAPEVDHVGDVLSITDVFALLSPSEAHPLSVTEAWLAGVPTVVSDLPWIRSIHQVHGDMSYFVDPTDAQEAARLIEWCSGKFTLTERAREIAWQEFTSPRMAYRYEVYFRKIMGRAA